MKKISQLLVLFIAFFAQNDIESAKSSVVKIKTTHLKESKKIIGTATGWCWNKPNYIITALHAVAGMDNIKVYRNKNDVEYANAKILRVIKEADLALLKIDKSLGLKPLETVQVDPNSRDTFYVWGFPHSVYSMGGDEVKFSRSLDSKPTLSDLLTGNPLKLKLSLQGYPLPSASIFRISSTIQPGHSGAPIFTKSGKVLGVADGGLRGGTARLNWAIPAHSYLTNILYSRDNIPTSPSIQTNLYNNYTVAPISTSEEAEKSLLTKSEKRVRGNTSYVTKTWTAGYTDIFNTSDNDLQNDLLELEEGLGRDYFDDMFFDIYEDIETGVSFAVPKDAEVEFTKDLFTVSMNGMMFMFKPFNRNTYEETKIIINEFSKQILKPYPNAKKIIDMEDEIEDDTVNEKYNHANIRSVNVDGKEVMLAVGGEAEKNIGAVMTVVTESLISEMKPNEFYTFMQLVTAIELVSFSKH